jgi:kynurenine formamidase
LLTKNGVWNLENLNLETLSREKTYQFLFIFTPVPFKGATGSPGRPIAIR